MNIDESDFDIDPEGLADEEALESGSELDEIGMGSIVPEPLIPELPAPAEEVSVVSAVEPSPQAQSASRPKVKRKMVGKPAKKSTKSAKITSAKKVASTSRPAFKTKPTKKSKAAKKSKPAGKARVSAKAGTAKKSGKSSTIKKKQQKPVKKSRLTAKAKVSSKAKTPKKVQKPAKKSVRRVSGKKARKR